MVTLYTEWLNNNIGVYVLLVNDMVDSGEYGDVERATSTYVNIPPSGHSTSYGFNQTTVEWECHSQKMAKAAVKTSVG